MRPHQLLRQVLRKLSFNDFRHRNNTRPRVKILNSFLTPQTAEKIKTTIKDSGIWFVDIPRTSSSSIRTALGHKYGSVYGKSNLFERDQSQEQLFIDHVPAHDMRKFLGASTWDSIFTFTVIRNPWDRCFSLYQYMHRSRIIPEDWTFSVFVHELSIANEKTPPFDYHGHRYRAVDFILDSDGTVLVDKIIRFEDRNHDLAQIGEKFNIPEICAFHLQGTNNDNIIYREHYNSKSREIIGNLFEQDIKLFNYKF